MNDTNPPALLSRRDAIGLFAATPALGADAALSGVLGGTTIASVLGADVGSARAGASQDLSQLAAEHFEALIGETFTVGGMQVRLRNVRRGRVTQFRQQFAMIFEAPQGASIGSKVAPVSHPAIGRHDLFVTEADRGAVPKTLEICFS